MMERCLRAPAMMIGATTTQPCYSQTTAFPQLSSNYVPATAKHYCRHGDATPVLKPTNKRWPWSLQVQQLSRSRFTTTLARQRPATESEESLTSSLDKSPPLEFSTKVDPSSGKKLFSNLNGSTLKHEPGSLGGSILLVAGTTVGAGILAIPAVTQEAGFLASAATCVACWSYMVATGLLVAEVNVNTMCELGSGGVSLVSMAFRTLGQPGVRVACMAQLGSFAVDGPCITTPATSYATWLTLATVLNVMYLIYHYALGVAYVVRGSDIVSNSIASPFVSYLFIHYALLVAYIARSSEIVSNAVGSPLWLSACLFTGLLGGVCFFGSQRVINNVNGVLVSGIIVSFAILVVAASSGLDLESLERINVLAVPQSIPIIALSFVYQNVVPVVCTSLEGDLPKIRTTIVLGTAIPLFMFLAWDGVILGSIPFDPNSVTHTVADPLLSLRSSNGIIGPVVEVFSFLAIATSYIGFVLGLADFLSDLLKMPSGKSRQFAPYLLTLLPPLALALISPNIFFDALDFAGTYGVLVLFGILPAAMAWSERYTDRCLSPSVPPLVPGGQLTLVAIIGFATLVITSELASSVLP